MYNEIIISEKSKIIIYQDYNFWDKIINNYIKSCDNITIITYNMNFDFYGDKSFLKKVSQLLDKGCFIRLVYAKPNCTEKVNNFINSFGAVGKCTDNHSKIFYSDNVAYIGSSNFSFASNHNIESGFITTDKEVIKQMTQFVMPIFTSNFFTWQAIAEKNPISSQVLAIKSAISTIKAVSNRVRDGNKIVKDDLDSICHRLTNIENYASLQLERQDIDYFCEFSDCFVYSEDNANKIELLKILDGILSAINDYLLQIEYCLARGGAIRLYYEEGELSDEDLIKMYNRCDGNYPHNED